MNHTCATLQAHVHSNVPLHSLEALKSNLTLKRKISEVENETQNKRRLNLAL